MMRVSTDEERFTGDGRCDMLAPPVFAPDVNSYGQADARKAAATCAERAILVEE